MQESTSGATSSEQKPAYHLLHPPFTEREAKRFALGAENHGDVNYQKSVRLDIDPGTIEVDASFWRERYNHAMSHLLDFKLHGNVEDDNLAAVAWFCHVAAWLEDKLADYHFSWDQILTPHEINESWITFFKKEQ